jgi:hypothetical protein
MRGMSKPSPIIRAQTRTPGIGKGGQKVRGTAAQRREFYEKFREHTEEVRDRLLEILRDPDADNGHVIQAAREILNRGWGAAPQVQVLEAVFQHQHVLNTDALRQLPAEDLARLEGTLARLVEVEDAEVIETPNESAEHAPPTAAPEAATAPRRRLRRVPGGDTPS